jgi:two-component system CheB/CheR fusion protein
MGAIYGGQTRPGIAREASERSYRRLFDATNAARLVNALSGVGVVGPGGGSRPSVELPHAEAPRQEGTPPAAEASTPRITMLLIEDNADTRCLLAESFMDYAYSVLSAESGEEALDMLSRGDVEVDVILSDIGLPGMDGYEFLRQARRLPTAARAAAFALTGFGQESDLRRAREAGYVDHFVKPLDVAEMDRRIRARLSKALA